MNKVDKVICKNYYFRDFVVLKGDYFDGILLTQDFCSIKSEECIDSNQKINTWEF